MAIRLRHVSLPYELEQDAKIAFQEFLQSNPNAGDYTDQKLAQQQIVEDLEWYENKITIQVSPRTPQPPGRSLANARQDP
jgi:hypothetical protein